MMNRPLLLNGGSGHMPMVVGPNIEHLTTTVWLRLSDAPPVQARKHSSRDFNCCDVMDVRWPERLCWSASGEPYLAS